MKLFLFKPSEDWSYCGGGLAIIAETIEQARTLTDQKLYETEEDSEKEEKKWEKWTLVESFEIFGHEKPRVVFEDYNWG